MNNHTTPTAPREAPALMGVCPRCSIEAKYIPAGISKRTGNPYREFWSCRTCKDKHTKKDQTWVSEKQWWYLHDVVRTMDRRFAHSEKIYIPQSDQQRNLGPERLAEILNLPGNGKAPDHKRIAYSQPVTVDAFGNVLRKDESA